MSLGVHDSPGSDAVPVMGASQTIESFTKWQPSVFFIGRNGDQNIPFWKFLRQERQRQQLSWGEMEVLCGVSRLTQYACRNSYGHPNEPPQEAFERIIQGLGYAKEAFRLERSLRSPQRGNLEYDDEICRIGEAIRAQNAANHAAGKGDQLLSSSFMQKVSGQNFFNQFGYTLPERMQILTDLHAAGYTEVRLQNQKQNRGKTRRLSPLERFLMEDALEPHKALKAQTGEVNIAAAVRTVQEHLERVREGVHGRLSTMRTRQEIPEPDAFYLEKRSTSSTTHHVYVLMNKELPEQRTNVSPEPNAPLVLKKTEQQLQREEQEVDAEPKPPVDPEPVLPEEEELPSPEPEITEEAPQPQGYPELDDPIAPIVAPDPDHERRALFLANAPYAHQAIIAYLMEPAHYKALLGDDVVLINVDFSQDSTPKELFEAHKERLQHVQPGAEDMEVTGFVDGWLRCDMIFKSPRGYTVVEVKQYAVDKEKYPNAQKARQQLASYGGVLGDNVKHYNMVHFDRPSLPEDVRGALAAFSIQEDLRAYLELTDRLAIELDRDEVMAFAAGLTPPILSEEPSLANNHPAEEEVPVPEPETELPLPEVPVVPETAAPEVPASEPVHTDIVSEPQEKPHFPEPDDHGLAKYERKKGAGDVIIDAIQQAISHVPILRWDSRNEAVENEIGDQLVVYTGQRLQHALQEGFERGVVVKGRVDLWKYKNLMPNNVRHAL